jgi:hypothetical protein
MEDTKRKLVYYITGMADLKIIAQCFIFYLGQDEETCGVILMLLVWPLL